MARVSYGDEVAARVRKLLERFLAYANNELEDGELYKIALNWETPQQVIVRTQLRVLAELGGLTKEEVREALKRLEDFLGILEDLRVQKRGSEEWYFRLKLWHDKSDKHANLQKFDAEWQSRREELPGVQREKAKKTQSSPTRYENLPFSGVVEFVGRERELQNLHRLLRDNQQVAIAAIAGMGGVGKTELALQYANSHRVTYQGGICWLSALQDVGVQLVDFARNKLLLNIPDDLDLAARVQYCLTKWYEGEVLLIIDNVTNYRDEVRCYLDSVPARFKQLITTRERLQPPIVRLDLDVLTPLAAMQLLKSIIGRERLRREPLIARKLCKWLGYLPLGLELVGRYLLGDEELSLTEMLQDLENERLKNPALDEAQPEMTAELGVAAAFELSWKRLREKGQILAQHLGCVLSLFALAPIPWELVDGITINDEAQNWKQARRDLLQLHLLQFKGEGTYQLHPLLREFFKDKLEGLEQKEEFKRSFCGVMVEVAKDIPQEPTLQQIKDISPAIPHLAEVANNLIEYANDEDSFCPFDGIALFYRGQGLYDKAEPWFEQCREITKERLGEESEYFAASLSNLGSLYFLQGKYSKAELTLLQSLELTRRLLGDEHPNVAANLGNLGSCYSFQGKYSKAELPLLQGLELTRRLLGDEHPNVATAVYNLGNLYLFQGKYSKAETFYSQALELRLSLLGEDHPDVATSLASLGNIYSFQGKYSEAEHLLLKALELKRSLLRDDHPDIATSLHDLGNLYTSQGKYVEAEHLLLQALEIKRHLPGEKHPNVALSLKDLGNLYRVQGRYSEAEPLLLQALELTRGLLGEENPDVALSLNNLALLYDSQGRYSEAESTYIKALELCLRVLGEEHFYVAQSLNNLGELYGSQGRYSEAESFLIQTLKLKKRLLGDEHPEIALSLHNLANLYFLQGKYSEAEPLYLQALELRRRFFGEEHPDFAISLIGLATSYYAQGQYTIAEPLLIQALALTRYLFGEEHPDFVTSLNNLANLYSSQGRYREAESLILQALAIGQRLHREEHPDFAINLANLAGVYISQRRYSEAKPLFLRALNIFERHLGLNHPYTMTIRNNLASLRDRLNSQQ
ncbi:tetratricopeptide repeat protein [Nostoc spongiaeforme FACHB-130]|uniref:Tetratricopeptide repeat protein n=1 Tax=Nostoc spongiaeforme FACHB-130 TaxID=1357510 RepID=A0ABR8G1X6_9NOSO|nr:tetratricopeptide repeat protein [Nostoc spongiaeforme]MBD2597236.1 tetratricopeptide repeat protein [Nostoc spongiaeforme FACHB-130]